MRRNLFLAICLSALIIVPAMAWAGSDGPPFDSTSVTYDFGDAGKSDLAFADASNGAIRVRATEDGTNSWIALLGANEEPLGAGKFGSSAESSFVARDTSTGLVRIVEAGAPNVSHYLLVEPRWSLIGIGQINDDDVDDFAFYKTSGENTGLIRVIIMGDGTEGKPTFASTANAFPDSLGSGEIAVGIGNLDENGGGEILVQNATTGVVRGILMDAAGTSKSGEVFPFIVPTGYTIRGLGYVNDDARSDFIVVDGDGANPGLIRVAFVASGGESIESNAFPIIMPADVGYANTGNYTGSGPSDMGAVNASSGLVWEFDLDSSGDGTLAATSFPGLASANEEVVSNQQVIDPGASR
ncbi:hypothetical protein MK489_24025 [Myxococcota bacterium]|nr:hypothetical protein [Myxococcota bacterium]